MRGLPLAFPLTFVNLTAFLLHLSPHLLFAEATVLFQYFHNVITSFLRSLYSTCPHFFSLFLTTRHLSLPSPLFTSSYLIFPHHFSSLLTSLNHTSRFLTTLISSHFIYSRFTSHHVTVPHLHFTSLYRSSRHFTSSYPNHPHFTYCCLASFQSRFFRVSGLSMAGRG